MCIPKSPNILTIVSEAPFITLGCSIKSSDELTKPVNLIQDLTFVRSLLHAFLTWAVILSAHLIAALYPSSVFKSFPSFPLINSPFSSIEIWPDIYNNLSTIT